jgi:hypothetical protein
MKKIIVATVMVALATALPKLAKAQAPDTNTIEKLQRYIAGPIDKTQIPTGFLEDYGAPFVPLTAFNGMLSDSNDIEINAWRLLYFQLQTSYAQAGTNPLPSIIDVNTALSQNYSHGQAIPIALFPPLVVFFTANTSTHSFRFRRQADLKSCFIRNSTCPTEHVE